MMIESRLTHRISDHAVPVKFPLDFIFDIDDESNNGLNAIFCLLSEYEEIGLSPQDIVSQNEENKSMCQQLDRIRALANNSIYFSDRADYLKNLWDILLLITPESSDIPLSYIEE